MRLFTTIQIHIKGLSYQEMIIMGLLILLGGFVTYCYYDRRNFKRSYITQMSLLEARSLQAQMNPHFIFNVLNGMQSILILKTEKEISNYMGNLSQLLRMTLDLSKKESISLREEITYLQAYIELQRIRLNKDLDYCFDMHIDVEAKKFFISISTPGILNTKRFRDEQGYFTSAADRIHLYVSMGKNISISEQWELTPYFLTRWVDNAPFFTSLNTAFTNENGYEMGLEYNLESGFGGNLLFDLGGISFGYAYTTSMHSEINEYSNGSHELLLKIKLGDKNNSSQGIGSSSERNIGTKNLDKTKGNRFAAR